MRRDPGTEPWVTPTLERQVEEEKAAKKSSEQRKEESREPESKTSRSVWSLNPHISYCLELRTCSLDLMLLLDAPALATP